MLHAYHKTKRHLELTQRKCYASLIASNLTQVISTLFMAKEVCDMLYNFFPILLKEIVLYEMKALMRKDNIWAIVFLFYVKWQMGSH